LTKVFLFCSIAPLFAGVKGDQLSSGIIANLTASQIATLHVFDVADATGAA
jgi:hypothetical protein